MSPPTDSASPRHHAFWQLYEPQHEAFVRYCQARAYGEWAAEDLVHESLLRAFDGFDRLKQPEAFLYFLFGIARRVLSQAHRRSRFSQPYNGQEFQVVDAKPSPEQQLDTRLLYEALDQLPAKQQEALILYEICGYKVKEIQQIQQAGASAIKARLARGRKRLSQLLQVPATTIHPVNS